MSSSLDLGGLVNTCLYISLGMVEGSRSEQEGGRIVHPSTCYI